MKRRTTSVLPVYLAVVGSIFAFPSAILSGTISLGELTLASSNFFLITSLIGAVGGLIFGLLTQLYPFFSGIMLLFCGFLTVFTVFIGNLLAMLVSSLFFAAGLLCFTLIDEN